MKVPERLALSTCRTDIPTNLTYSHPHLDPLKASKQKFLIIHHSDLPQQTALHKQWRYIEIWLKMLVVFQILC